jgi:hypothetical protein
MKAQMQQLYQQDLANQIKYKQMNQNLENRMKEDERNMIRRNLDIKRTVDNSISDSYQEQKKNFMEGARAIIDKHEYDKRSLKVNEKMLDKERLEMDQKLAMEHEIFKKQMLDRQKVDMVQVNHAQMNEKRHRDDLMRKVEREEQGTNPAHLGNGYR